ncbi:hypothetical protein JNX00_10755 [Hydrogenophaga sp. YM1]|jgi:hypothetical protein|uniref:hypothetical protein n=1 Tax=unclassified Hydrogenophaga TaxID=2610897 RepID=UPI0008690484|nr:MULTISPECIES: hypothetical protein [unclassified Hydrogenophaga]MBN9370947.1 hypothetical protein [Hydrogenophaga sp.]ODT34546.1 MAG: hypothetical protein ABS53_00755 [Hydrogenophaga sp. SCN 70-13]OJV35636.1 MAG: hypothetical protein BGO22_12340 [Hydrogenophaga sp. 70-12]QRR36300.1 hypothetical protein JNX00_10755 [Hydrogenophaga sp. YM1]
MKLSHALLTTAFSLSLAACGGGGGDAPAPASADQAKVSLAEFEGVWKRDAAHDVCVPDFVYNQDYAARVRDVTLTKTGSNELEIAYAVQVYSDDACTVKQGLVRERFTVSLVPVTRAGRDNVVKGIPRFVGAVASADGGAGITLTALPDGRMTGLTNVKTIGDVQGGRLQFSVAEPGQPVDADGYPNDFNANDYFVR